MKRTITALLFLVMSFQVFAHGDKVIRGVVTDEKTGETLMSAAIQNQVSGAHTHSDLIGKFILEGLKKGDSVKVTFLGYEPYVFVYDGTTEQYDVKLKAAPFALNQIVITPDLQSISYTANISLKLDPVNSSQGILQKVPGLFIAQHAGGGKAEQIFLRGFDIDHGTDIKITADGMPVNMVSHAHGQGYSDLHFVIPETVEKIDFGKGPYNAENGNFTTAGYVDFQTYDRLPNSMIKVEAGRFNTLRWVGMIDLLGTQKNSDAYIATEYIRTDGPFESPQDFDRVNLLGKYTTKVNDRNTVSLSFSTFQSKWDASGQVPLRAVASGQITRFGAIDDTEGGKTSRTNFNVRYQSMLSNTEYLQTNFFYARYDFELFSNFTFFLNDPVNGDQITQREGRNIYGANTSYTNTLLKDSGLGKEVTLTVGVGFRYDDIDDNELSRTKNRQEILSRLAFGDVNEFNGFAYASLDFEVGKWLINPGLRIDYFDYQYYDRLAATFDRPSVSKNFVSPKLNIVYNPNDKVQLYWKVGRGFHSNDSRVVVQQQNENILPAAYGTDLGASFKATDKLYVNVALWYLFLEQEFVYVGDEAVVEPSGETERIGVDVTATYQIHKNLFADFALNFTRPRAIEEADGEDFIPLAPTLTSIGGLSYIHPKGFSAGIKYRYIKDRAANETNSVTAEGYFVTDLALSYDQPRWGLRLSVENLFDVEWNEAQFDTESQLQGEANPVSEIHFTPGTPFFLKSGVVFKF